MEHRILKMLVSKNETFYDVDGYYFITSKGNKFYDDGTNFEWIQYLIKNNVEPLEVHENIVYILKITLKEWKEEYKKSLNTEWSFPYSEIENLQVLIEKMEKCSKLEDDTDYHLCPYCEEEIVKGSDKDILCGDCIMTLRHARYSEL